MTALTFMLIIGGLPMTAVVVLTLLGAWRPRGR